MMYAQSQNDGGKLYIVLWAFYKCNLLFAALIRILYEMCVRWYCVITWYQYCDMNLVDNLLQVTYMTFIIMKLLGSRSNWIAQNT